MIGVSKPFSRSLHKKNDPKSRAIVKKFFLERGVVLIDHPNQYDIDLVSDDGTINVEVEHRNNWDDTEFPYEDINVPERKAKFFENGKAHYVILSRDYSHLGVISAEKIQRFIRPEYLKESSNKFVREAEYFYKVPKTEFEFYPITNE